MTKPTVALTIAEKKAAALRVVLSPEIEDSILKSIKNGLFERQACQFAGVVWPAYQQWKRWAIHDVQPYTRFFRAVAEAKRAKVEEQLARVTNGDKEWKAAAWWLDRMYPEWREGNLTDDPLPEVGAETIVRFIRERCPPEEIGRVVSELTAPDPDLVMGLLPAGGVHDDERDDHEQWTGPGEDPSPGCVEVGTPT